MSTPKQRMINRAPNPYCVWNKEFGVFDIYDDGSNRCFRDGHKSAKKAWEDLEKLYNKIDKEDCQRKKHTKEGRLKSLFIK